MTNRDKILNILQKEGALCDSCLQQKTHIKNHATVNQITRELVNEGVTTRSTAFCPGDKKVKIINRLIDGSKLGLMDKAKVFNIEQQPESEVNVKQKWYWEGNIQNKIVHFLKERGCRILRVANTETKEAGVDIIAISSENKRLLVSIKGYPFEENKSRSTQARHWFAEAIFDLVLYRQDYPEVDLAVGFPDDFPTYQNLSQKASWFKESLPFRYYWVGENGKVKEE